MQLGSVSLGIMAQRLIPKQDGQGRVAAIEVLVNTPAIANLIRSEKVHQIRSMMQTGKNQGMQTMDMALRHLLEHQEISMNEARKATFGFAEL